MADFIHPTLMAAMKGFFTRKVTIQTATISRDAVRQRIETWGSLANHVDLACFIGQSSGIETRQPEGTRVVRSTQILLNGYYPLVKEKMRAVTDDGKILDILQVRSDSSLRGTELICEAVT